MGQVYRGLDARLGREVAIKILPPDLAYDANRLRRFQQEARATGALNHPNILAIYDIGTHDGGPYLVCELLEGQTVRERLAMMGRIPARKAIELAIEIARGLAAAHDKGVVHRDIKPENLFITREGHVKILDFGLAKLNPPVSTDDGHDQTKSTDSTIQMITHPGAVLGTVGYMSPEQVRGSLADHRSDIFAFGAVLYEMLSGRRAFWRDSAVSTMNAILEEEPPDLTEKNAKISPLLARLVRHCMEKEPDKRYQSTSDLLFDLEMLLEAPSEALAGTAPRRVLGKHLGRGVLLATGLALIVGGIAFVVGESFGRRPLPTFHQLTFRRGTLQAARFTNDGRTIVFGAAWSGAPIQLYSTRPENPSARPLGFPDTGLLAVSHSGELAISRGARFGGGPYTRGMLARVPLSSTAPRDLLAGVEWADWEPGGENLAIVRTDGERNRLEFPIGKVLYQTAGWISHLRFSPRGDYLAFFDHPAHDSDRGDLALLDLSGNKRVLSQGWVNLSGLAWAPGGREVWFTSSREGNATDVHAATLEGHLRLVSRDAGRMILHDIASDGRILLARDIEHLEILGQARGEKDERHLCWLDGSTARDLSADGKMLLFDEQGEGGGPRSAVYIRPTDGSDAIRLGPGAAMALSPDDRWAITIDYTSPPSLVLLPTGAGEPKPLPRGPIENYHWAAWLPDGKRVLFAGNEPKRGMRLYEQDLKGGLPKPVSPEGVYSGAISPDGKEIAATDLDQTVSLYSLTGEPSREIPGMHEGDLPILWTPDGKSLLVYRRGEVPAHIIQLDMATGERKPWKDILPADRAGVIRIFAIHATPDLKSYVYTFERVLSDLYLAEGLK